MKKATSSDYAEAIEAAGYEPRSYSGRGMYGDKCLGVVCENTGRCVVDIILEIIRACSDETDLWEAQEIIEPLRGYRHDNMGLDYIVYWPSIEYDLDNADES